MQINKDARRTERQILIEKLYLYDFYHGKCNGIQFLDLTDIQRVKFNNIINEIEQINQIIESNLFSYSFNRLNLVDKAIIRLATYELLKENTPYQIIINEALELTKEFTELDDKLQHKFNNKLLDNIKKQVRPNE